jgi:diguanylate cyclase (GGDEF)-like protein
MPETELDDAMTFAEKIRSIVEATVAETQAGPLKITVSIGVSSAPRTRARNAKELVIHADKALYRAKKNGRNRVEAEKRRDVNRTTRADFEVTPVGAH